MTAKALTALAQAGAVLAALPGRPDRYGVYPQGDRRRRPRATMTAAHLRALLAEGTIAPLQPGEQAYALTPAGRAVVQAPQGRIPLEPRTVMEADGAQRAAIGAEGAVTRLARQKTAAGEAWLTAAEVAAARRLSADVEDGARGGLRLSRWDTGKGGAVGVRGSAGAEAALAFGAEARARAQRALAALAPPLRHVAERACLEGVTLEEVERSGQWPARSGKVALKLALSQLALAYQAL